MNRDRYQPVPLDLDKTHRRWSRDPEFRADKLELAKREAADAISRRNDEMSDVARRELFCAEVEQERKARHWTRLRLLFVYNVVILRDSRHAHFPAYAALAASASLQPSRMAV